MKIFLLTFLLMLGSVSYGQQPLQRIVVGGSTKATLGQSIAGYSADYHVGIRTPVRQLTSVSYDTPLSPFVGKISPNPCDKVAKFNGEQPKSIKVFDVNGNEVFNCVDLNTGTITFPITGVYYVRVTNNNSASRTFTIVSK